MSENTGDSSLRAGELRQRIVEEARPIHSVARVLSAFQQCDRDTVQVDPVALGIVHEMIVGQVLAIYELLETRDVENT